MFNKFKTATAAVITATATLLGGGQAWALDIDFNTQPTKEIPISGCDPVMGIPSGVWSLQGTGNQSSQYSFSVCAGTGFSGEPGGASIIINAPNYIMAWTGDD